MTTFATTTTTISASKTPFLATPNHYRCRKHVLPLLHTKINRLVFPPLRVTNDANKTEVSPDPTVKKSDVDKIMDEMDFGELCNEFECISSPLVESTARQLVLDILQLREGNRALGTFAISVKYKDPVRSFTGREKYKRPLWITDALENTKVTVQEMVMLSTSVLNIKWTIKGKPKSILASVGGDLILKVNSKFTLNQISGQVIEHEESWDLSESSPIAQAYFWSSRRLFAAKEAGKDVVDSLKNLGSKISTPKENIEIYPDPSGDPTKFFQRDDSDQRDLYQIALLLALVYFVVQYLKITL
ncbi:Ribosomal protein S12 methylthiotransferase RimO [Bienertia sinuspersici]